MFPCPKRVNLATCFFHQRLWFDRDKDTINEIYTFTFQAPVTGTDYPPTKHVSTPHLK